LIALGTSFATDGFTPGPEADELDAPEELDAPAELELLLLLLLLLPHAAIATAQTSAGIATHHVLRVSM
jgi:hypothetical protein